MKFRATTIAAVICIAISGLALPAWAPDAFSEGILLFNQSKWPQAAERLTAAAARNPNDPTVRLTAGVALANIKRYSQAAAEFQAAARLSPDSVLPYLLLDGTYTELGSTGQAREARNQANRLLGSGRAFGTPASSDRLLSEALVKHPSNAIARCLLGDLYQLQGKLQLAREQYAKASQLAPKWPKPVFNLGLANLQSDAKAAERNFDQAIQMDPQNARIFLWQGDAYLRQHRYSDAIGAYRNAAKDKALAPEANTRIGNAELQAGNYKAATEQFQQASQLDPKDARPIAGEAQAYQNVGKLKEAETKYNQAAQVMATNQAAPPSRALVQRQIASVQVEQGKVDEAISNLVIGYSLHPTPQNADELARTQQAAGKLTEGIADRETTLKKNPNDRAALTYLLSAHKVSGNWVGVIDIAGRLCRVDQANTRTYMEETGAAYMKLGDTSNAVESYMRAMNAGDATAWPQTATHAKTSGALPALEEACAKAFKTKAKRSTGIVLLELRSAKGDTAGAVDIADQLTRLNPDDATLWLRLGQAYEQAGSKDLALAAYSRAAAGSSPEAATAAKARMQEIRK